MADSQTGYHGPLFCPRCGYDGIKQVTRTMVFHEGEKKTADAEHTEEVHEVDLLLPGVAHHNGNGNGAGKRQPTAPAKAKRTRTYISPTRRARVIRAGKHESNL